MKDLPLAYRKVGRIRRAWRLYRFEKKGKRAQRKREREFKKLINK